ncbi:MAG: glutaredoxin family protein [Rhodanobacter sp.]
MPDLILYQRDYCHLCDLALAVLAEARVPDFDSAWVDDSAELEARYGVRVPVLCDTRTGRELDWPFDAAAVRSFLDRDGTPSSRRKPRPNASDTPE